MLSAKNKIPFYKTEMEIFALKKQNIKVFSLAAFFPKNFTPQGPVLSFSPELRPLFVAFRNEFIISGILSLQINASLTACFATEHSDFRDMQPLFCSIPVCISSSPQRRLAVLKVESFWSFSKSFCQKITRL